MAQSTPAGESSTAQPQPTKIKLMKRNSSDSNRPVRSEKESQSRSNISMTERERQYAEARARIFGTSSPSPSTEGKEDGDGASSESAPSITRDRSRSPTSTEGEDRPAEAPAAGPTGVSAAASAIGTKGPRRKVVNPGTWQGKKGVLRDKEAEKNDPDFRRHHHPPAYRNPSPTYVPYGAAMDPHMGRGDGSWMPPQQHAHVPYGAGMHYPVYGMDAYQQYYHQGYQQHAQVPRPPPPSAYDYNQEFPPLK